MGCGASKQTVNTVEDAPPMKQKEATEPVDVPLQEKRNSLKYSLLR